MSNTPSPPRLGGTFVGLWVCHKSVVGGSLKSPPAPPPPVVQNIRGGEIVLGPNGVRTTSQRVRVTM